MHATRYDKEKIKLDAKGRWREILENIGIDPGDGKPGPCIICGGKDRYVFDDKYDDGSYFCRQCGAGTGFQLIMKCKDVDFPTALKMVAGFTGTQPINDEGAKDRIAEQAKIKKNLNDLWTKSIPLVGSDPVSKYLRSRGIMLTPENVRYCPKCFEADSCKDYPAMVSRVHGPAGKPVSIHRTYLADVATKKKIMPCVKKLNGAAIRLMTVKGDTIGIAEGVETALSAAQLWDVPVWAAMGTSTLETWQPPEGTRKIIIFADNDANFAGQAAAYVLAHRLYLKDCIVSVEIPDIVGDFNDVLVSQ